MPRESLFSTDRSHLPRGCWRSVGLDRPVSARRVECEARIARLPHDVVAGNVELLEAKHAVDRARRRQGRAIAFESVAVAEGRALVQASVEN
jgi:hypothetical protein